MLPQEGSPSWRELLAVLTVSSVPFGCERAEMGQEIHNVSKGLEQARLTQAEQTVPVTLHPAAKLRICNDSQTHQDWHLVVLGSELAGLALVSRLPPALQQACGSRVRSSAAVAAPLFQ